MKLAHGTCLRAYLPAAQTGEPTAGKVFGEAREGVARREQF